MRARIGAPIASRELVLDPVEPGSPSTTVTVLIAAPVREEADDIYRCDYQILGLRDGKIRHWRGADSLQALVLALHSIAAEIYTSEEAKAGRLYWFEKGDDLGIPLQKILRALERDGK